MTKQAILYRQHTPHKSCTQCYSITRSNCSFALMRCLQPVHAFELTIKPPKSLDLKLRESIKSSHLTSHLFLLTNQLSGFQLKTNFSHFYFKLEYKHVIVISLEVYLMDFF